VTSCAWVSDSRPCNVTLFHSKRRQLIPQQLSLKHQKNWISTYTAAKSTNFANFSDFCYSTLPLNTNFANFSDFCYSTVPLNTNFANFSDFCYSTVLLNTNLANFSDFCYSTVSLNTNFAHFSDFCYSTVLLNTNLANFSDFCYSTVLLNTNITDGSPSDQPSDTHMHSLMFVPCIIGRSRNNQHYELICTTPFYYTLAPTCLSSSMPSSGSFLDPFDLLEIQIEWVVYRTMCGYVTCVPECCDSVFCIIQLGSTTGQTTTIQHTRHVNTHYMIYHLFDLYFRQLGRIQEAPCWWQTAVET
jgi:hypothetical protein